MVFNPEPLSASQKRPFNNSILISLFDNSKQRSWDHRATRARPAKIKKRKHFISLLATSAAVNGESTRSSRYTFWGDWLGRCQRIILRSVASGFCTDTLALRPPNLWPHRIFTPWLILDSPNFATEIVRESPLHGGTQAIRLEFIRSLYFSNNENSLGWTYAVGWWPECTPDASLFHPNNTPLSSKTRLRMPLHLLVYTHCWLNQFRGDLPVPNALGVTQSTKMSRTARRGETARHLPYFRKFWQKWSKNGDSAKWDTIHFANFDHFGIELPECKFCQLEIYQMYLEETCQSSRGLRGSHLSVESTWLPRVERHLKISREYWSTTCNLQGSPALWGVHKLMFT